MTTIEWTDETWNPVTGCSHVSDGCKNCYAEGIAKRFSGRNGFPVFQPWTARNAAHNVVLHPERLDAPLHWRKPRRVFVNSMSDLFHDQVPEEFIERIFDVMRCETQHTFQVLTKRPERMRDIARREVAENGYLPNNIWLGVSAEDQATADERIPVLLDTPAAIRFVSAEPLLRPIDLERYPSLDWVIVGGESGHGARPCDLAWIRNIVEQCKAAAVPVFVKQLGSAPAYPLGNIDSCLAEGRPLGWRFQAPDGSTFRREANGGRVGHYVGLHDRKGGDPAEWPDDLRVREWPTEGVKA